MMPKQGVVLSGGGARGAYQIGVLKALKKHGILSNVQAYSGASVGSLNAIMLAMDNLDLAEEVWLSMDEDNLFSSDRSFLKALFQEGMELMKKGFYSTNKLETMIDKVLDFDVIYSNDIYVATSHVGDDQANFFELVSVNIRNAFHKETMSEYSLLRDLSKSDIKKTLLASCALPIMFKPVVIQGETYYDGGMLNNTPCEPLTDCGCDEIFLIDLFRFRINRNVCSDDVKFYTIKPSKNLRRIMDFSPDVIAWRFDLGFKDGEAFAMQYKENKQENKVIL